MTIFALTFKPSGNAYTPLLVTFIYTLTTLLLFDYNISQRLNILAVGILDLSSKSNNNFLKNWSLELKYEPLGLDVPKP